MSPQLTKSITMAANIVSYAWGACGGVYHCERRTDRIMLLIEAGFVLLALLLAFVAPRIGSSFFIPIEQWIASVARHRRLAVLVVGVIALALRAAVLPISARSSAERS